MVFTCLFALQGCFHSHIASALLIRVANRSREILQYPGTLSLSKSLEMRIFSSLKVGEKAQEINSKDEKASVVTSILPLVPENGEKVRRAFGESSRSSANWRYAL